VHKNQFAEIDGGFLTWDFNIQDEKQKPLASVSRNFIGLAKEVRTFIINGISYLPIWDNMSYEWMLWNILHVR
jgi:hypothetical protein